MWVLCGIVILILGACAVATTFLVGAAQRFSTTASTNFVSGPATATWTSDGEWIVAQSSDARGETTISAVRPSDGTKKSLHGFWLVAIEPTGARVRVMADPGTAPFDLVGRSGETSAVLAALDALPVAPDAYIDSPGTRTLLWDLTADASPTEAPWAESVRDASHTAAFDVGTRGAYPMAISLRTAGTTLTVDSTRTLLPLGWSASGRYYAAAGLLPVSGPDDPPNRTIVLHMWDLSSGREIASVTVDRGIATRFVWSPVDDAIYWSGPVGEEDPHAVVRYFRASAPGHISTIASLEPSSEPLVIGADGRGVLVRCIFARSNDPKTGWKGMRETHVLIVAGARLKPAGYDSVKAVFAEAGPEGVLYWMPWLPSEPASSTDIVGPGASGIDVWHSSSIETTPTLLLHSRF